MARLSRPVVLLAVAFLLAVVAYVDYQYRQLDAADVVAPVRPPRPPQASIPPAQATTANVTPPLPSIPPLPQPMAATSPVPPVGQPAPPPPLPRAAASGRPSASVRPHPLDWVRLDNLRETTARPLFEPARRPAAVVVAAAPVLLAPTPQTSGQSISARVVGTIVGDGRSIAVLLVQGQAQPVRVTIGDKVDAWVVETIGANEVVLSRNGQRDVLQLARKRN